MMNRREGWAGTRPDDAPLLLGHRGVRGARPENTMAAFELAREQGADGIELDVRPCASGELIVFHDPTLKRVSGGADDRAIAALSLQQLEAIDVGEGARIPTLGEVLRWCQRHRLALNVELKSDVPSRFAAVRAAARLLRHYDPRVPLVVSSFDPIMILLFQAIAPEVRTAQLLHPQHRRAYPFAALPRVTAVHLDKSLASRSWVRACHALGKHVAVWTVNDAQLARELVARGVDAIISDVPDALRAAVTRS